MSEKGKCRKPSDFFGLIKVQIVKMETDLIVHVVILKYLHYNTVSSFVYLP